MTNLRKIRVIIVVLSGMLALMSCFSALAHELSMYGRWAAFSLTARATTGDIQLAPSSITFGDGQRLQLSFEGKRSGVALGTQSSAAVFRIRHPRNVRLRGGNYLCGKDVLPTYFAISMTRSTAYETTITANDVAALLRITAISGEGKPNSSMDRLRLCAEYTYTCAK